MPNHKNIQRVKFILALVLMFFSTLLFGIALVFGAFNTNISSGFEIDYYPVDEIAYTANALNEKLSKTQNLKTITFDYDDGVTYETIKVTGKPYVEFSNYTGSSPISSYAVATETTTDVYFLCEEDIIAPTNCTSMFESLTTVKKIHLTNFNTANTRYMGSSTSSYGDNGMFYNCTSLETITFGNNFNTANVRSFSGMFCKCFKLTSLDLTNFNTSNATNMSCMFSGSNGSLIDDPDESMLLQSIKFGDNFNTDNVTKMRYMFAYCENMTILDVSNFNTAAVTTMEYMFFHCDQLTSLDVSNFNTSNVTNMSGMFFWCYRVTSLDLRRFDTSKVTEMSVMFARCEKLTSLDLSNFDTSNVTNMHLMFAHFPGKEIKGLTTATLNSNFNTSKVTNMSGMFSDCSKLTNLDLSNFNTGNVKYMDKMFWVCEKLTNLDLSNFNTGNVTDMSHMFYGCDGLTSLNVSNFITTNVTDMECMFYRCSNLTSLDLSSFDTSKVTNMEEMFATFTSSGVYASKLVSIYVDETKWSMASVTSSSDMFKNCLKLKGGNGTTYNSSYTDKTYACVDKVGQPGYLSVGVLLIDSKDFNAKMTEDTANPVEKIVFGYKDDYASTVAGLIGESIAKNGTDDILMYRKNNDVYILSQYEIYCGLRAYVLDESPFQEITSLKTIEFNNFNTSNVTDMSYMFYDCSGLINLNVTKFNTTNVTNMGHMFSGCSSLTSLNVSNFDTGNVTDMVGMFSSCSNLTSLYVTDFNTANVTNMKMMFFACSSLTSLDLSKFNTANVTDMSCMFTHCKNLTFLDVTSFDTSKVTSMSFVSFGMFQGCKSLSSLELGGFNVDNVIDLSGMFADCDNLITLDLSNFNTVKVEVMKKMFYGANNLKTIFVDQSKWSTANVISSEEMFGYCYNLVGGASTTYNSSYTDKTYARVDDPDNGKPGYLTKASTLLEGASFNAKVKLVGQVQKIVFDYSYKPEYETIINSYTPVDVTSDSSGGILMYSVLDTSTSKYDVYVLSNYCIWAPENCSDMFSGLYLVTEINLNNFNTSKVTNMSYMFAYSPNVTSLNFGNNFTTKKVTNMYRMFFNLANITTLDISSFETTSLETIEEMFNACQGLITIYADPNKWIVDNVTNKTYVFINCHNIVGGQGSTMPAGSNTEDRGGEFARVDGGTDAPGYFTDIADKP